MNNLCGSLTGYRPVHLILYRFKEDDAAILCGIIIETGCVNIGNLLVEPAFGCADVLNPASQFFEIIEGEVGILHAGESTRSWRPRAMAFTAMGPAGFEPATLGL